MMTRVLDASVAVAWYLPESFSAKARYWQAMLVEGQAQFLVPMLHFWEVANVLRTYVRRKELAPALAQDIYEAHVQSDLDVVEPDPQQVLRVALDYEATAYDSVYVALSLEHDVVLLTAERRTTPWVTKLAELAECISDTDYPTGSGPGSDATAGNPWLNEASAAYSGNTATPRRIFGTPLKGVLDDVIKQAITETNSARLDSPELRQLVCRHLLAVGPTREPRLIALLSERLPDWRTLSSAADKEKYLVQKLRYRVHRHLPRLLAELAKG
jgi:predicted nucleic acid-binding protein